MNFRFFCCSEVVEDDNNSAQAAELLRRVTVSFLTFESKKIDFFKSRFMFYVLKFCWICFALGKIIT